jgi:glycosyltransferase involved in cell wall biosynthesis
MHNGAKPVEITILGVHVKSEGYPNVTFRIRDLFRSPLLRAQEINFPFGTASGYGSWRSGVWKPLRWLWMPLRACYAHLHVMSVYLIRGRPRRLYVPYPAAIVLFCLSLLPRTWRPACVIADCFISLYDTVITDRKLFSPNSWSAQLLKFLESRAYRVADRVIVDTDLNAKYFAETFGLDPSKLMALPLSIDETHFRPASYQASADVCTVLFVGTFVPLQGVDVIARAAMVLESRPDLRFRLIGSGQTAEAVARIFSNHRPENVEWITRWMGSEELAQEIREADICLGIFDAGPKTQRVWPLKNYAYMAVGRAMITADTSQARQMLLRMDATSFMTVPAGDPMALADAISSLAGDPDRRRMYAENARRYYESELSSQKAVEQIAMQFARGSNAVSP